MKIRLLIVVFLAAVAVVAFALRPEGDKPSELADVMAKMGQLWRKARAQVADPARNADTIERFTALKQGMLVALSLEPEAKMTLPRAERPKFMAAYQAKLKEQMATIDEIVALLQAGKNAEAAALTKTMEANQGRE